MATSPQKVLGFLLLLVGIILLFYGPFFYLFSPFFRDIFYYRPAFNFNFPGGFFHIPSRFFPYIFFAPWMFMLISIILSVWAFKDAENRGMNGWLWGLLVFLGNIVGLIVYLLVRSPQPGFVPGAATTSCPYCGRVIQADFVVCPYCNTSLVPTCPSCRKRVQQDWQVCPYCATALKQQRK